MILPGGTRSNVCYLAVKVNRPTGGVGGREGPESFTRSVPFRLRYLAAKVIVRRGVRGEREGPESFYRKGPVPRRSFLPVPRHSFLIVALLALTCVTAYAQAPTPFGALKPEQRAQVLWEAGYVLHLRGDFEGAISAFRASIAAHPTAEGHTFLGWSLSHLDKTEEAIAQCKIAIGIDPDFGNPYNDIGVYLMNLNRPAEAVQWFEKAIASRRYCCYEFPHFNLGRVLLLEGKVDAARRSFEASLKANPEYLPARIALEYLRAGKLQGL